MANLRNCLDVFFQNIFFLVQSPYSKLFSKSRLCSINQFWMHTSSITETVIRHEGCLEEESYGPPCYRRLANNRGQGTSRGCSDNIGITERRYVPGLLGEARDNRGQGTCRSCLLKRRIIGDMHVPGRGDINYALSLSLSQVHVRASMCCVRVSRARPDHLEHLIIT